MNIRMNSMKVLSQELDSMVSWELRAERLAAKLCGPFSCGRGARWLGPAIRVLV